MISDNLAHALPGFPKAKTFCKKFDKNKPSLQYLFWKYWDDFLCYAKERNLNIRPTVLEEVSKMIDCGTFEYGFEVYECPNCHNISIICYTCKSRFCSSCGIRTVKERAVFISQRALDVKHRHIVFTIDERLRDYFLIHRDWLHFLFDAVRETLFYAFNRKKPSKKKKARKRHKYHPNFIMPGFISTLHTFGRDLKWNPHIHVLCTDGGFNSNHLFVNINYIDFSVLRKTFMTILLKKMKSAISKRSKEYYDFSKLVNTLYKDNTHGFYVYAPPAEDKYSKRDAKSQVISYMIRYAGRPAMADSRISNMDYDSKTITYWYDDHRTGEHIIVNEHIFEFFAKLIRHIPDSNFKMIRYYGVYSTSNHRHKQIVIKILALLNRTFIKGSRRLITYRKSLLMDFNVDPLLCTCGHYLEFLDYYINPKYRS